MNKINRGPIYMLITGLFFSIGGLCMKVMPWHALSINAGRCIISVLIISVYAKLSGHRVRFNKTVFLSAAAMAATTVVYALAVKLTTAGAAIVIQFTVPVWTMVFSFLFFKKKPLKDDVLTALAVFAGIGICFYDGLAEGRTPGNLLALISGMTYSGAFMSNAAEDSDPLSSAIIAQLAGFFTGLPFLVREDMSAMGGSEWAALISLGVFQLGLGYIFFAKGLETTPPVTACLITGVEPVLNPLWVALFYNEQLTSLFIAGAAVVLASVSVYNIRSAKRLHEVLGN